MRLIDVDNLIDDCKRYLATLNPGRDGKECTRIRWLIGVLDNAPSVNPDTPTDCISRRAAIEAVHENYDKILDFKSDGKTIASSVEDIICDLPSAKLKRDIPMKPMETTDRTWGIPKRQAVCPRCDYYLGNIVFLGDSKSKKISYCETCGQAIDWEGWKFDG